MDQDEKQIRKIISPYLTALTYHLVKTKPRNIVRFNITIL